MKTVSASCDQFDDDDDGDGHGRPWQAFAALATSCTTRATKSKGSWEDGQPVTYTTTTGPWYRVRSELYAICSMFKWRRSNFLDLPALKQTKTVS